MVFYKDRETGSSSDEELIASEADRNSWAGASVEWPFVIYKEISNGHDIRLYTSTCKQMNKPQTEGRRASKTPMQELGCCKDSSHYHSQPVLQRYPPWIPSDQARRHHKNSHQSSSPQFYPTEKMKALRISPYQAHRPFTPQRNSHQHFQTQGVLQGCSNESRRPDPSKLKAKEIIRSYSHQPRAFTASQTADMLCRRNHVEAATQRIDRDSRPPPSQQFARKRNGTVISTPVSKGRESWSRITFDFPQQSRNEPCEATGNQWRRRRIGVYLDTEATQEQRRFTRVLAKRF